METTRHFVGRIVPPIVSYKNKLREGFTKSTVFRNMSVEGGEGYTYDPLPLI